MIKMSTTPGIFLLLLLPTIINSLANCPSGCECNDETLVVTCNETNLDVMPIALNPSIKKLIMRKNKIKSIESSIQFYPDLEYLDLSENHLLKLISKTFQYQKRLIELNLGQNKISTIESETFQGLEKLEILNLRGNLIDDLKNYAFSTLSSLEELNLGQNRIATIEPDAFYRLYNLKILYLDDNSLTHVPSLAFPPLTNLAELYIGVNSFTALEKNVFEKLIKLTVLSLNGAQLHNISIGAFNGLEGLRTLDLSSNRLTRVPTKELAQMVRLEELSIGMNDFDIISEKAFEGLSNLHKLEVIGATKLLRVQNNAFIENGNLRVIRMTDNVELSQFESAAFHGLPYLKELILRNNAIESLRENSYEWNNLEILDLSDNPLRCDCHLLWYKTFLQSKRRSSDNNNNKEAYRQENISNSTSSNLTKSAVRSSSSSSDAALENDNSENKASQQQQQQSHHILCTSPQHAKGKELIKLSSDLFGCTPNSDPKTQAIICGVLVITAAVITALILFAYKCRRRKFRNVLKDSSWEINSTIGRKDRDYHHKAYAAAPQYLDSMHKHAMGASPSLPGANYQQHQQYPMIPITEL